MAEQMCTTQPSSMPLREIPKSTAESSKAPETTLRTLIQRGCTTVAFFLPLKLSLTYAVLVPLIVLWLYTDRTALRSRLSLLSTSTIISPLSFFLLMVSLSALTGLSLGHSLPSLLSLLFFTLSAPLFCFYAQRRSVIAALLAGQSIAALHSVLENVFPHALPRLFLGEVTESGQLAITMLVLLGAIWTSATNTRHQIYSTPTEPIRSISSLRTLCGFGAVATGLVTFLAFQSSLGLSAGYIWATPVALAALVASVFFSLRVAGRAHREIALLLAVQMPLLLCALLVNLKRGPWLGVLVGLSLFCAYYARRLIGVIIAVSITVAFSVQPIYDRIASSYDHFTIAGGRSTIWRIGAELIAEYPLGVGYHNSGILRQFDPQIPPELKHFHNNLLNIVAENGWLAGLLFVWFLLAVCRSCFRTPRDPMYVAIGCALVSWQTAGLVEYNFGDSEVMLIVWILIGLILQREVREPTSAP